MHLMGVHEKLETEYLFGKRVPRRIFGPKMEEVTVGRRKLRDDEFHGLSFLPDNRRVSIIRANWDRGILVKQIVRIIEHS